MTKFISIEKDTQEKKETVFTKHYDFNRNEFVDTKGVPEDWDNVVYLGYKRDVGDMFKCSDFKNKDKFNIFIGTKGDETYN